MVENTRILFVDDEERNCKLFKRYFARNKAVDVITALSAEDAKVVLERLEPIHILVTDQRMPISKGHALLCHCHESYPHIYRVLTTANVEEAEQLMMQSSMRDIIQLFIHKPWDSSEIRSLATFLL